MLLRRRLSRRAGLRRAVVSLFLGRSWTSTENARALAAFLARIARRYLAPGWPQLGRLVILEMFERWHASERCAARAPAVLPPGRIVLLGSPVRGSRAARNLAQLPFGRRMLGLTAHEALLPRARSALARRARARRDRRQSVPWASADSWGLSTRRATARCWSRRRYLGGAKAASDSCARLTPAWCIRGPSRGGSPRSCATAALAPIITTPRQDRGGGKRTSCRSSRRPAAEQNRGPRLLAPTPAGHRAAPRPG